uniref:Uncharacterized protein n=1 Tax=Romanomermis culicivorax TaxID=13658 RepID=A0A915K4D9_ROMCU
MTEILEDVPDEAVASTNLDCLTLWAYPCSALQCCKANVIRNVSILCLICIIVTCFVFFAIRWSRRPHRHRCHSKAAAKSRKLAKKSTSVGSSSRSLEDYTAGDGCISGPKHRATRRRLPTLKIYPLLTSKYKQKDNQPLWESYDWNKITASGESPIISSKSAKSEEN